MERPLRPWRLAASGLLFAACLLTVALWVRSYSREDIVTWGSGAGGSGCMFASISGEVSVARFPSGDGKVSRGWDAWSNPHRGRRAWEGTIDSQFMTVRYRFFPSGTMLVAIPLWWFAILFGGLALLAARQIRFNLRTMLLGMTLAAVLFGLAVILP